jgi:hypothetical protein
VAEAAKLKPVAYHLFAVSGDLSSTYLINEQPGATVYDTTDLLETTYLGDPERIDKVRDHIEMQVYGLRHADGYCARDLQFKFAQRVLGYRLGGPAIFFPEYCWGTAIDPVPAEAELNRPIRCVQAGNFGIEKLGAGDEGYLRIGEKFAAEKVALHIYPNWIYYSSSEEDFANIFSEYMDLARKTPYFVLNRPLPADQLVERLRAYDFGVAITWAEVRSEAPGSFNAGFRPYCMSARLFEYIDAGLPVVLSRSLRLMHALLRKYDITVKADAGFMQRIEQTLRPLATIEAKRRAVAASRGLAIDKHIPRLTRFYEQVATRAGIRLSG